MTTKKSPAVRGSFLSSSASVLRVVKAYLTSWRRVVATISTIYGHPATRFVLLIMLMIIQLSLALLAMYLIDLGISLMELWAELARKHLELTL